jgi:hypothetical protein
MKVGQKTIVRWMSKLVANGASRSARKQYSAGLRELDAEQLRHVSGGNGGASQSPNKGW